VSEVEACPLSFDQLRLWFPWRLDPQSTAYNLARAVRLRGSLNVSALGWALDEVVARQAVLRTSFPERGGRPFQAVAPAAPVALPVTDLTSVPAEELARRISGVLIEESQIPFDLTRGPVFRARLVRMASDHHILSLVFHHVVMDAQSLTIFFDDLSRFYAARATGRAAVLEPLPADYRDYVRLQGESLAGGRLEAGAAFWCEQLAGAPQVIDLPTDRPRPVAQTSAGAMITEPLPARVWDSIVALCARSRATPFMGFLAAYAALLSRLGAGPEVVVGTPVSGRTRVQHEEVIGFFANTLPLRVDMADDPPFDELLRRVRQVTMTAFAHQDIPFQKILEARGVARSPGHSPVFQAFFTLEYELPGLVRLPGIDAEPIEPRHVEARFDLSLVVRPSANRRGGHEVVIVYNRDLFDRPTIERLVARYIMLLQDAACSPGRRVRALSLLGPGERARLAGWSSPQVALPAAELVHARVARQALERAEQPAVVEGAHTLSYGDLDRRAARLADRLHSLGAGPERVIGVMLPRSIDLVVAELAILKAGAAYLPFDASTPPRRLAAVLAGVGAPALVTTPDAAAELEGTIPVVLSPDEAESGPPACYRPARDAGSGNLAYVIATSGSTGVPKLVMVEHGSLASMARWYARHHETKPGDRAAMMVAPSFDGSVAEIWGTLVAGATLHVADEECRFSAARFRNWALKASLTQALMPVPLSEQVVALDWPATASLRALSTGADRLRIRPRPETPFRLINLYGPTEGTFAATAADVRAAGAGQPPIGKPIGGAEAYVLDSDLEPVGMGMTGELYLGGVGLARGYLGQPGQSAERFLPHPFSVQAGARLYRTGDLVRWRADGNLDFVGRSDDQLKIRGYRIEPGEIEAALRGHPGVRAVHVIGYRESATSESRLVAYVVAAAEPAVAAGELREHLAGSLPHYMLPDAYVMLERLPLTAHGKIDRRALPEPGWEDAEAAYRAPGTELERNLAEIWQQVLQRDRIGIDDNFFELGGHSLLLVEVQSRVLAVTGLEVPILAMFEKPTVALLASHLAGDVGDTVTLHRREALREAGRARFRTRRRVLLQDRQEEAR
jgi:amino acid adenylation domain-containing protein